MGKGKGGKGRGKGSERMKKENIFLLRGGETFFTKNNQYFLASNFPICPEGGRPVLLLYFVYGEALKWGRVEVTDSVRNPHQHLRPDDCRSTGKGDGSV